MNNSNITADHNTKNTITEKQLRATASVARPVPRTYGSQNYRFFSVDFQAVVSHCRGQTFTTFCRALLIPGTPETTDVHRLLQSSLNPVSQAEASSRPSGKCSECVHGGLSRAVVFFLGRTCLLLIFHLGPCPNQRLCC